MNSEANKERQSIIITICSTKGGVGKTTLAANIGGLLVDLKYKVLLIDGDIQPGLSSYYSIKKYSKSGLSQLIKNEGNLQDCISNTVIPNLDIVISNDPDGIIQDWITGMPAGRITLKGALDNLRPFYDFIIIDSQGANSPLQHTTVLAADILVSPIPPDIVSSREFQRGTLGMLKLLEPLSGLTSLGQLYGLIYRKDRTKDAQLFSDELTSMTFQESKSKIRILNTMVQSLVAYKNASTDKIPVHKIDQRANKTMCELVSEILPNLTNQCKRFRETTK
jgi:chromosome partitioning related protein ParA